MSLRYSRKMEIKAGHAILAALCPPHPPSRMFVQKGGYDAPDKYVCDRCYRSTEADPIREMAALTGEAEAVLAARVLSARDEEQPR